MPRPLSHSEFIATIGLGPSSNPAALVCQAIVTMIVNRTLRIGAGSRVGLVCSRELCPVSRSLSLSLSRSLYMVAGRLEAVEPEPVNVCFHTIGCAYAYNKTNTNICGNVGSFNYRCDCICSLCRKVVCM